MPRAARLVDDQYFQYTEPFPGVVFGLAKPNAKVVCNALAIDLGGAVLAVDAQSRPSVARAVIAAVRRRFDAPVRYLVNSHHHWDHCQGNLAYLEQEPPAEIIAHPWAIAAIGGAGPRTLAEQQRNLPAELAELRRRQNDSTGGERAALAADLAQSLAYAEEIAPLTAVRPTRAVASSLVLAGHEREVRLLHPGPAHTPGDLVVQLPAERAVATGDCLVAWTPFVGDGNPATWASALDTIADGPSSTLFMGHGEPADPAWLRLFQSYLRDLLSETRRHRDAADVGPAVRAALAARYRAAFDRAGGRYRRWDDLVLRNVEHVLKLFSVDNSSEPLDP